MFCHGKQHHQVVLRAKPVASQPEPEDYSLTTRDDAAALPHALQVPDALYQGQVQDRVVRGLTKVDLSKLADEAA